MVRRLLFDGEPGLATAAAQKWAFDKYNIRLYADSSFKRNMAERAIRGKSWGDRIGGSMGEWK